MILFGLLILFESISYHFGEKKTTVYRRLPDYEYTHTHAAKGRGKKIV